MESNVLQNYVFKQPVTLEQRKELAKVLVERLKYRMPVAIDDIDGRAEKAFAAWPERIYVLEQGGRVLYKGGMGPFKFHPEEAEKTLASFSATGSGSP